MRKSYYIWVLLLAVCAAGCPRAIDYRPVSEFEAAATVREGDPAKPLYAGFSKRAVTPRYPVWIAGFGPLRMSLGAHDDIMVRAVFLRQGDMKLAMVEADLIGLQRGDIEDYKAMVDGFSDDEIIIACTHTHAGPDTLGLWGVPPVISGKNPFFMKTLGKAIAETILEAEANAVPVRVASAVRELTPGIMVNFNEGEPVDNTMGVAVFRDVSSGEIKGAILNVNGHPEAMWSDNHILSADYAGRVCELTEAEYGGVAVFMSGALGAMMSPARPVPPEKHDFKRLERISQNIFADIKKCVAEADDEESPRLRHLSKLIMFPIQNDKYLMLQKAGIIDRTVYEGNRIVTKVNLVEIGEIQFVTFPGEAYPKLGLNIRARQNPKSFQIGLADDELGYIIYPEDHGTELYEYESSMCPSPELSVLMEQALLELIEM